MIEFTQLNSYIGQTITVRARLHFMRVKSSLIFMILRYQTNTLQVVVSKKQIGDDKFTILKQLNLESILNCTGKIVQTKEPIKSVSYSNIELFLEDYSITSKSNIPIFTVDNLIGTNDNKGNITQPTRLDNRFLDLRNPLNNILFKIKSDIVKHFRDFLQQNNFIEIHTPKLISTCSESGAQVFKLDYFEQEACLAQSPQLYKQMAINSDFDRVFEIGSVFRAEESFTNRHLCEFTGLDLEMTINQDYKEVQIMIWNTLDYIFTEIKKKHSNELEHFKQKYNFEYPVYPKEPLIISFTDCVEMLNSNGKKQEALEDLSTENEKFLGDFVKQQYNTDLFVIDKYPQSVRPFYTKPIENSNYSMSFDFIFRSTEICSGAQRINDYELLLEKVKANKIDPKEMKGYLDSFAYGSMPHGGCGLGLERIVSLYLNVYNVKMSSFCPRDPKRLTP